MGPSGDPSHQVAEAEQAPVRIRPARDDDRDGLVAMFEAYTDAHRTLRTPPKGREAIRAWVEEITSTGETWVALAGSTLVGCVTIFPAPDRRAELSVYVHPAHFDRSIGTALCRHAIESVAGEYDALWLVVERANTRALTVFRKVGFEVTAYHRSDIEMRYRLDEA